MGSKGMGKVDGQVTDVSCTALLPRTAMGSLSKPKLKRVKLQGSHLLVPPRTRQLVSERRSRALHRRSLNGVPLVVHVVQLGCLAVSKAGRGRGESIPGWAGIDGWTAAASRRRTEGGRARTPAPPISCFTLDQRSGRVC